MEVTCATEHWYLSMILPSNKSQTTATQLCPCWGRVLQYLTTQKPLLTSPFYSRSNGSSFYFRFLLRNSPKRVHATSFWYFCITHTHTHTHTQPVGLIDQISQKALPTQHNRRTSTPSAGFEPAIPAIKRLQTYALDHVATVIRRINFSFVRKVANSAIRNPQTAKSFPFNTCLNRRWA